MQKALFELRILGPTELHGPLPEDPDALVRQSKRLALLAYLALSTADGFRRRDLVIALFWPELEQAQARTYLRKALHSIREALGKEVFVTRGEDEIRVDPALVWCDAVALSQLVLEERWNEALALYRGELLEGLFPEGVAQEFHEWLSAQRKTLRERAAQAAWEFSRLEEERGDRTAAAVMARRARELDPDNEEGVRRLMGLLDRRGDRGSALRVYSEWQSRLLEEFGVEPAPETRRLARQIQAARKGESHETAPAPAVAPPQGHRPTAGGAIQDAALVGSPARRRGVLYLTVVALAVTLGAAAFAAQRAPAPHPRSIAVIPLRLIADSTLQSVADVIMEELTTRLTHDSTLSVIMTGRENVRSSVRDVTRLGRDLHATLITDGALQRGENRVRVTIRLVRSADGVAIWAGQADIPDDALSAGAQGLATDVTDALMVYFRANGAG